MKNVSIISFLFVAIQIFNIQPAKAGKLSTRQESFSNSPHRPGNWKSKKKTWSSSYASAKQMDKKNREKNKRDRAARKIQNALRVFLGSRAQEQQIFV